jgi:hypothetical protein
LLAYDGLNAPAATCGCSCGAPQGVECSAVNVSASSGCASGTTCVGTMPGHQCVAWNVGSPGGSACSATPPSAQVTGGSCAASPSTTVPVAMWSGQARACSPPAGACAGGACTTPALDPSFKLCVEQQGEQSCPAGWSQQHVEYATANDTRGCSACSCGALSGVSCDPMASAPPISDVSFYSDSQCTTLPTSYLCSTPYPYARYEPTPTGGSCAPSTVAPTGSATASGAVTFCCQVK